MASRRLLQIVLLAGTALLTARAALSQDSILPESSETVQPFTGPLQRPPDSLASTEEEEIMYVAPDLGTFLALKEIAKTDHRVKIPALLVPPPRRGKLSLKSSLVASFAGLDFLSSGFTTPAADTTLAASDQRVLEATNAALQLSTPTGSILQSVKTSTFLTGSLGVPTADPKLFYDRNAANPRFYFTVLESPSFAAKTSALWLAVSRSANPADLNPANWCKYRFDGVRNPGTADASFADYPGLGAGAEALLVTTDQFRFSDGSYAYAILRVFNKTVLSNNASSCPSTTVTLFQPAVSPGDLSVFTLQPAQHYTNPSSFSGTSNPAYLVSTEALNFSDPLKSSFHVWRVSNVSSGTPRLDTFNITFSYVYQIPPPALQAGTGARDQLNTGDCRILQVVAIGNTLWATQTTLCNFPGSSQNSSCARILRIDVGQGASGNLTAAVGQQLTFGGGPDFYYWMPAIAVNNAQQVAVPFLYSSANDYLSSAFIIKNAAETQIASQQLILSGTCSANSRTGDFVGAQTNPVDGTTFWLATEAASLASSQNCQWKTWIVKATP